ncbi:MAG: hypothetical protein WBE48_10810 [Xanthobacteraceae bacterium]
MVIRLDLDDPPADAIDQQHRPDQIGCDLKDTAVEEAFGEAFAKIFGKSFSLGFVHRSSSQAATGLANACVGAAVAKLLVNTHLTNSRKQPAILWLGGNSFGTFQRIIFQDASRRFLAIGFFETIGCGGPKDTNAAACFRFQSASAFLSLACLVRVGGEGLFGL